MTQAHAIRPIFCLVLCAAAVAGSRPSGAAEGPWDKTATFVDEYLGDTLGGAIGVSLYNMAIGEDCKSGSRRILVQETDVWGLNSTDVQEAWVRCEVESKGPSEAEIMAAYQINSTASARLRHFLASANKNRNVIEEAGLSQKDLDLMARYKLPTNEGIRHLSTALGLEPRDTKRVLKKLLEDASTLNRLALAESRGQVRHF